MRRRSKRELERTLDELHDDHDGTPSADVYSALVGPADDPQIPDNVDVTQAYADLVAVASEADSR